MEKSSTWKSFESKELKLESHDLVLPKKQLPKKQ